MSELFVPEAGLIALRETLEAFLITGIVLGFVTRMGRPDARRFVWLGLAGATFLSLLLGILVYVFVFEAFQGGGEQWYELVADLVAVSMLTYMVFWMWKHTRTLMGSLREKVGQALNENALLAIAALVFVTVLREGLEIVLFYAALRGESAADLAASGVLGALAALGIVFAIFKGSTTLNLPKFFAVTGVFLIFIAAGVLMHAVHEAEEIGLVPEGKSAWDTSALIPSERIDGRILGALVGYRPAPTILQVVAYFMYLLGVVTAYLLGSGILRRGPSRVAEAPLAPTAPLPDSTNRRV